MGLSVFKSFRSPPQRAELEARLTQLAADLTPEAREALLAEIAPRERAAARALLTPPAEGAA